MTTRADRPFSSAAAGCFPQAAAEKQIKGRDKITGGRLLPVLYRLLVFLCHTTKKADGSSQDNKYFVVIMLSVLSEYHKKLLL